MEIKAKINKTFLPFVHDWEKDIYLLIGGYGSGKSYTTALKIILLCLREKRKILVVRKVKDTLKESCFEDLLSAIDTLGLEDYFLTKVSPLEISCKNGSRIIFRGLDKTTKIKSIKDIDTIWIEEASEINIDDFKELKKRLRVEDKRTHIFMTTNPSEISHWIAKYIEEFISLEEFYVDKLVEAKNTQDEYVEEIMLHHSTYKDNVFLPKSFESDLANEKNYLWRAIGTEGRFGDNGEKVFNNVVELTKEQMIENTKDKTPHIGFDFGFSSSYNAITYSHIDTELNDLYVYKEFYKNRMTDIEMLYEPIIDEIIENRYIVFGDSAEPKAIEFYRSNKVRMNPAEKVPNNNMVGVRKLWTFRNIYICKELTPNVYKEFKELTFYLNDAGIVAKNPKNGKIFTIDPHTFDSVNYALTTYRPTKLDKHRYKKGAYDEYF